MSIGQSVFRLFHTTDLIFISSLRMSATRIASIYNSLLPSSNDGEHSRLKIALDYNIIFDSFYLYSLLLDHQTHRESDKYHSPFVIPHQGEQAHRFDRAMEERNLRFAHNSRKAWSHACDDCFKVSDLQDGRKGDVSIYVRHVCFLLNKFIPAQCIKVLLSRME